MGIKEDIESIKDDLVGESRFLEQYIKVEAYIKKHKIKIAVIVVALIALLVGNYVMESMENARKMAANKAYLAYMQNGNEAELENIKDNNPALFTLLSLKKAVKEQNLENLSTLSKNDNPIIAKIARYHHVILSGDAKAMETYALEEKAFLKDFTALQLAFKLYEAGDHKGAQEALRKIPFESQLKKSAGQLEHYGLTR